MMNTKPKAKVKAASRGGQTSQPKAPRRLRSPRRFANHQVDQECFVRDVVQYRLTPARLARRHRQSLEGVHAILAGRKYPRIAKRIELALACERQRTAWRLAALQADAVAALETAVRGKPSSASLSAAKEILSLAMDAGKSSASSARRKPKAASARARTMSGETKRRVLAELGGPSPSGN